MHGKEVHKQNSSSDSLFNDKITNDKWEGDQYSETGEAEIPFNGPRNTRMTTGYQGWQINALRKQLQS